MQPPPQAVPSGLVGPPPAGNPQSMFWSNSPYRRQVNNSAPAAPITSPLQPVTDPFAFSRQTRQNTSLGTSSKSSPPILQGAAPPAFLQRSGQPLPHTNVRDSSQGPCEPPPRLLTQPRPDPSPLPNVLAPSSPAGPEMNRSAEVAPGSEPEVQAPLYPPQYIPGAVPDGSMGGHLHGTVPEPNRPLSRQNPHDSAAVPAASPFFPQALQQVPGQWGPVQGGPPPSSQPYWPYSEGPVPNTGPQASTVSHSPALSSSCQGSGQEHHNQLVSLSGPLAGDRRNEGVYLQSGNHLVNHFDTENAFRQNSRVGNSPTNQELRLNPGMNKEQLPALVNPPAQGNSLESHLHAPPGAKASRTLPEVDSGAISMFFQGGETENEENLSSEKTGSAGPSDLDSLSTNLGLGHPSAHAGGLYQAFLKSSSSETMQQGGDMQPYFSQSAGIHHEKQTTKSATMDLWGGGASVGASDTSGPQYENVENLDFVQNQEVLPSEPLSLDPSLSDQLRYVSQPGSVVTKHSVGHAGGGALNTEAPDAALYPIRSDSVSSSYSSKSHRSLSGIARPQDLTGTFIQQEVGKPENEASGSFFKQIDSSPIGSEIDGTTISQNYQRNLPQPSTPSPPKPVGIFQTSANSSFEPVKSHLIGVKPVEADRANVVGEVRGTHAHQKQHRPAAAPPDASPGNMEQPPDNMETLFTPQVCPLPLTSPVEPTHRPQHLGGPPLETMLPTPEKRPSTRVHGVMKCESPATTLWAQNELPDFGGNVILAPAAPVLHVPAKLQSSEVIQPPDESVSSQQSQQPDPVPPLQSRDSSGASENLENPPKMGEEDTLLSQVMKDAQDQSGLERTQQEPVPPPSQGPKATFTDTSTSGSPLAQGQFQNSAQPPTNPASVDTDQQPLPRPPRSSSASLLSTSSGHAAVRSDQQWPQSPPPEYYYYRSMYDGYQSQYPSLYPPDANTSSLYYQDVYGLYDPRYRGYDSTASTYAENYRHPEPERPSSRASHCSDRPHTRREYPESYYNSKSGWSSHSDYYANYYPGQYDYGDAGHWDRYHYSARFRDPRHYDQRYWYDTEYDPYRKENYSYGDRHDKYDDHWRYDPRVTGSFDEDPEPRRDPYGEETDRRSVHSEHSAQSLRSVASLHSHRSSFSSQSHQSQIYRSHNVATSSYEAPPPPGSFHGDYPYSSYGGGNFSSAQDFTEYGYPPDTSWPTVEQVPSRPTTPEKFSVPHVCARFGPGGHLIKVIPNLPSEGQPALVEIHSMETLLQHTPEQEEMRSFPGPLGKDDTHKVDVINFAQNKATKCLQNENLIDKESASLLWNFIVLLCRQNGTVVGTDIAELLLRDHKTVWLPGKSPNEANLIDFTNEAVEQVEEEESGEAQLSFLTDSLTAATSTLEKEIERFRELLLYGRKKDALESAMKNALWGHALLLASKMDSRTHARVMTRFANSLPINDPLQTVYQLMSGRMPAASTCCGDEKWGDWRPHLAMVLSNLSNNMDVESRTMVTMGDTLASKGLLDAAHFCYLMAQVGFGVYTKKTTKLVLIGSNHSLPFLKFASNEAIQRTEAYEYAQSLGAQTCCLPSFQVFKFIYSCRLAEMGLATQAFHYCEVIAKSILIQPHQYSAVLITQLVQVASQLRLFDPQLKEKPEEEAFQEPSWLVQLQHMAKQIKEGSVVWTQDSAFPQQCPSTPSSEVGQCDSQELAQPVGLSTDNPLLAPPMPGSEHFNQSVRLLPSAPQMLPSGHPANPTGMPVFPVLLPSGPVEPGPTSAPQGSALGFPETSGPNFAALYPGPGLPPGTSSLPETRSLEPGMMPQEVPDRKPLSELREGNFSGNFANLGPSGMPQDSEQASMWEPPLPAPTPSPEVKRPGQASKKETKEPKKSSESWFFSRWLSGKKRTEAYLPDDKNKSIVWDEKKNRWVDMNEPEEEKKAPPPPPATLPKAPQPVAPGPGGPLRPNVNMFSRKAAGNRARYVDILNPGGTQRNEPTLAPADFFAPLAPLPIPAHLMGPNSETEVPSAAGAIREGQAPPGSPESASEAKVLSSAASLHGSELPPSRLDGSQGGEAPSDPPAVGPPPGGAVPFYNPAQFVPTSATSGNSRAGRIGQRKYPALS